MQVGSYFDTHIDEVTQGDLGTQEPKAHMLQGRRIVEGDKRCCRRRELGEDRSQEAHPMQLNPTPPCACSCLRPSSRWRPAGTSSKCIGPVRHTQCAMCSAQCAVESGSRTDAGQFVQPVSRRRHVSIASLVSRNASSSPP